MFLYFFERVQVDYWIQKLCVGAHVNMLLRRLFYRKENKHKNKITKFFEFFRWMWLPIAVVMSGNSIRYMWRNHQYFLLKPLSDSAVDNIDDRMSDLLYYNNNK